MSLLAYFVTPHIFPTEMYRLSHGTPSLYPFSIPCSSTPLRRTSGWPRCAPTHAACDYAYAQCGAWWRCHGARGPFALFSCNDEASHREGISSARSCLGEDPFKGEAAEWSVFVCHVRVVTKLTPVLLQPFRITCFVSYSGEILINCMHVLNRAPDCVGMGAVPEVTDAKLMFGTTLANGDNGASAK